MNSKNHDLTEFEELIAELENPDVRPYAPHLPRQTKEEMRRALFTNQEGGLSRLAARNLWKFAGTAVAAILLIFIVASFIAVLSNPSTQTGPQENVVSPPQRTPANPTPVVVEADPDGNLAHLGILIGDQARLTGYQLEATAEGTLLRMNWLSPDVLDDNFNLFVHFVDAGGNLVLQADEADVEDVLLPTNELPNGRFRIIIGLYNTETGERLPVSANDETVVTDGGTAVRLASWSSADLQDRIWLVSASPAPGTNLYDTDGVPTTFTFEIGYELVSAESASLDWSLQPVGEGELPRYVEYSATADIEAQHKISQGMGSKVVEMTMTSTRVDGLAEAVAAQIWFSLPDKRITLPSETLEELVWPLTPPEDEESGDVWLVSLTQKERPSVDSPIELEITVGYEFVSDEDVFIKLSYADPEWESPGTNGRVPIDGLGSDDPFFFDKNRGEVTINAILNPNEAMQIVGNENPVVVAQLGYIDEYRRVLHLLANITFSQYPLDLTTTQEIQYSP